MWKSKLLIFAEFRENNIITEIVKNLKSEKRVSTFTMIHAC